MGHVHVAVDPARTRHRSLRFHLEGPLCAKSACGLLHRGGSRALRHTQTRPPRCTMATPRNTARSEKSDRVTPFHWLTVLSPVRPAPPWQTGGPQETAQPNKDARSGRRQVSVKAGRGCVRRKPTTRPVLRHCAVEACAAQFEHGSNAQQCVMYVSWTGRECSCGGACLSGRPRRPAVSGC